METRIAKLEEVAEDAKQRLTKLEAFAEDAKQRLTKLEAFAEDAKQRLTKLEAFAEDAKQRLTKLEEFASDAKQRLVRLEDNLHALQLEMHKGFADMIKWVVGTAIVLGGTGITVITFVLNNATPKATPPAPLPPVVIYTQPAPPKM